jgi:peptidoglycan/xylan/chitin deacetylase (PgdA/CDA1 family)
MRKKDILMRALSAAGVMKVRWRFLPPALYVFNFHRVGNRDECGYNRNLFSCTVEQFREHLAVLKDRFDFVTVDRLADFARRGYAGRRPLALVTFDDGYADNYLLAFPVLKQMEVPAVFFLPTAYVGTRRLLWSDEIAWMLRNSRQATITLPYSTTPYSLSPDGLESTIRGILRQVRQSRIPTDEQLDAVRQACGGVAPAAAGDRPQFVTWEQVREMAAAGMDIGSHTHTHTPLARLDGPRQRAELADSRAVLEGELRAPVRSVAYPVGDRTAYTAETCQAAREVGYELGFNFLRRPSRFPLTDALDIGRFGVDSDVSAFGVKSRACFPGAYAN